MRSFLCLLILADLTGLNLYSQIIGLKLKVYLEGPFNGITMSTSLNGNHYLPLEQPYNSAPWHYQGSESVPVIPNPEIVDWILVELRETAGDASTAYEGDSIASFAGFLLDDGWIVSLDGFSPLQYNHTVLNKLYAIIWHRNHLPVLSAGELFQTDGSYTWDFTTGQNQAYGGLLAHKQLSGGVWGMVSGDGDANSQVNNSDKNEVWKVQAGASGYKPGDFNLNGQVDNVDKNDYWIVNSGRSGQLPGPWNCGKPIADDRDGRIYPTVYVDGQCWLARNLNTGTMVPGNMTQSDNGAIEKYCYEDIPAVCEEYGGLYQWNEMMQYDSAPGVRGICPDGWHLPTDAEWCLLEEYLDPAVLCDATGWRGLDGGGKLKEAGTAHWQPPNTGATNSSGFTALPGGCRLTNGDFSFLTQYGIFWSSSDISFYGWFRYLFHLESMVYRDLDHKGNGLSVRCLKN